MRLWDISEPISPKTAVFPGDTPYTCEWVARMEQGASCNVSTLRMSVHCGSHADAPLHYALGAPDVAALALTPYLGRCRVIEVPRAHFVPAALIEALHGVERLLLKTSRQHDAHRFDPEFTALGVEAARAVVARGIKLVGIDTPSMDHADSKDLAAHHVLLRGDVRLLENLDLATVEPGEYELIALPLKIVGSDAAPVRAVLRELPR